ncbi:MAG TPA: hypothetical protein VKL19_08145 [Thermoanaerobaculia bacterium]|nr:hypothetical protein [Thermoanaerobaculia bacterium]
MTAAIIFALIAGVSVATILWLLYRLNRFQRPQSQQAPGSIFLRRWSYILNSESYVEPGRSMLRRLRISLAVLAVSVVGAIISVLLFAPR